MTPALTTQDELTELKTEFEVHRAHCTEKWKNVDEMRGDLKTLTEAVNKLRTETKMLALKVSILTAAAVMIAQWAVPKVLPAAVAAFQP